MKTFLIGIRCLIILTLIFPATTFSQEKNPTAFDYYINNEGDSIHGIFTDYKDRDRSPALLEFKKTSDISTILLSPSNCRSVHVKNEDFISYSGTRLVNPITQEIVSTMIKNDSSDIKETVSAFVKVIYRQDNIRVLMLNDKQRVNIFFQEPGQAITELSYKCYVNDENKFTEISTYKTQILELFSEQVIKKNMLEDIDQLKYNEPGVFGFFEKLLGSSTKRSEKKHLSFFISGGISINQFKAETIHPIIKSSSDFKNTITPALSAGLLIPVHKRFERIFLSPQLRIYSFKTDGHYMYDGLEFSGNDKNALCFGVFLLGGYKLLQYNNNSWNILAGAGLSLLSKNEYTVKDNYNPDVVVTGKGAVCTMEVQSSLTLFKNLMLLGNFSFPVTVTNFMNWEGKRSSIQISLGWQFKR